MADVLINNGANVNAIDNDGNTPLHKLIYPDFDQHQAIATLLVKTGADVQAKNDKGETPIIVANCNLCLSGNIERKITNKFCNFIFS